VAFLDESSKGIWTITITDKINNGTTHNQKLNSIKLNIKGREIKE
jgi:hypothetical protein